MLTQLDQMLVFADVDAQSRGCMPCNVTMQDPQPRVVGPKRHGHVAIRRHQGRVSSRWILVLEGAVPDVVGVEGSAFLRDQDEIMAMEMHRVGQGKEDALALCVVLSGAVNAHDHVNPVLSGIVFGDKAVLGRIVIFVAQVIDEWIGQIEPHRGGRHVPAGEVAMRDGVVLVGPLEADLKVVACQLVDCEVCSRQ